MDLVDQGHVQDNHMMTTDAIQLEMDALDAALQANTQSVQTNPTNPHVLAEIHAAFEQTTLECHTFMQGKEKKNK
jgi:hypothetical protein